MRHPHIGHMTTDTSAARLSLLSDLAAILAAANASSSHNGTWIKAVRSIMAEWQGNVCAGCGHSLIGARIELCHINPFKCGYGIGPGNVYVGCKDCNDYDRLVCKGDAATIVSRMVRPDLVARTLPTEEAIKARMVRVQDSAAWSARDALA